jgi:hypothetical protein
MFRPMAIQQVGAMQLDQRTLAYVAGIVDGEGCIAIRRCKASGSRKTPAHSAIVTVGNTSRKLIEYLVGLYGFGTVTYRAPTKERRGSYLWTVESKKARTVIAPLRDFLVIKREQAALLIEFVDGFESFKGARPGHRGGIPVSDAEMGRRAALHDRMRELNRTGPRDEPRLTNGRKSTGVTAEFMAAARPTLLDRD